MPCWISDERAVLCYACILVRLAMCCKVLIEIVVFCEIALEPASQKVVADGIARHVQFPRYGLLVN